MTEVEAVDGGVDEREDLEEGVIDAIDEGEIEVDKADGGVFEGNLNGLDEGIDEDGARAEVILVDLALGAEAGRGGEFAKALGAAEEDGGGVCFGEEEVEGDADRCSELPW